MAENSWWDVMVPRQEANRCDKMALVANCTEHYGTYRPRTKGTYCHEPHQEFKLRIWSSCGVKDFNHRFEQHVGWACAPMSSGEGCFAGTLVQTSCSQSRTYPFIRGRYRPTLRTILWIHVVSKRTPNSLPKSSTKNCLAHIIPELSRDGFAECLSADSKGAPPTTFKASSGWEGHSDGLLIRRASTQRNLSNAITVLSPKVRP